MLPVDHPLVLAVWNGILTVGVLLVSIIFKGFKQDLADYKTEVAFLRGKLAEVELLVAGKYLTREEFKEEMVSITDRLNDTFKDLGIKIEESQDRLHKRLDRQFPARRTSDNPSNND